MKHGLVQINVVNFMPFLIMFLYQTAETTAEEQRPLLFIHKILSFSIQENFTITTERVFKLLFLNIYINDRVKLTVGTIYRSPSNLSEDNLNFIKTLNPILKSISKSKTQPIIFGNFNHNFLEYKTCMSVTLLI